MEQHQYAKGAYNVHEHNHTEWSDERLHEEAVRVAELRAAVNYVGERAVQMALRANLTMQEQMWRYAERHGDE